MTRTGLASNEEHKMSEDRTPTFSQKEGYDPLPEPLQLGELPGKARTAIWNVVFEHMESSSHEYQMNMIDWQEVVVDPRDERPPFDPWDVILRDVHVYHNNHALDEWSTERVGAWMRDRIKRGTLQPCVRPH